MKLWVIHRGLLPNGEIEGYEVVEPIQRTIYRVGSRSEEFVRYNNHYYPVRPVQELQAIVAKAQSGMFPFTNPYVGGPRIAASLTKPAPFIFLDEIGPLASIRL